MGETASQQESELQCSQESTVLAHSARTHLMHALSLLWLSLHLLKDAGNVYKRHSYKHMHAVIVPWVAADHK